MKRMLVFAFTMLAVLTLCQIVADDSQATVFSDSESNQSNESAQPGLTMERMNLMPLSFTENQGQWDERVKFRANAGGAMMWYTTDGVYYQFTRHIPVDQDDIASSVPSVVHEDAHHAQNEPTINGLINLIHEAGGTV